jgi:hypothetical protein
LSDCCLRIRCRGNVLTESLLSNRFTYENIVTCISANLYILQITKSPAKLFPTCSFFTSRSLATDSNSGHFPASRAQVISSQSPSQYSVNSTIEPSHLSLPCRAQLNSLIQTVLLITSRRGPHRKRLVSTVNLLLRAYQFPREHVYRAVAQKRLLYIFLSRSHCGATSVVSLFFFSEVSS